MKKIEELLSRYPKTRPDLSREHQEIYEKEYLLNREGLKPAEKISSYLEGWMHNKIARYSIYPSLELGAGTLNHLEFERNAIHYDIVEPFTNLYRHGERQSLIGKSYQTLSGIPKRKKYKRIFSIAVLEHMVDLPKELSLACDLLDDDGVFLAGIPSEGGFLWHLGWRVSTGLSYYIRNRLDYGELMRHEHVNTADEIITLIKLFFVDVSITRFPLPFHHLSLYVFIEAKNPRVPRPSY